MEYWDIVQRLESQPQIWQRQWDPVGQVPFVHAPSIQGGTFITYDDEESTGLKLDWLEQRNLRGVMFWELSGDLTDGTGLLPLLGERILPQP
jgi:chitinase